MNSLFDNSVPVVPTCFASKTRVNFIALIPKDSVKDNNLDKKAKDWIDKTISLSKPVSLFDKLRNFFR